MSNKNHNYNTNSNVYRINKAIYERIKQYEKESSHFDISVAHLPDVVRASHQA